MKDRIPILNILFNKRTKNSDKNINRKRNRINNINTFIPKTNKKAMNSENADIWKEAINKEL